MTDWAGGYIADIEYGAGFYREQAPGTLDAACLIRGLAPPPRRDGRFRYCELGCGQGLTALVLAAANPRAEIVAVDFNPAHIARASDLAAEAGLGNVRFIEAGFADLTGPGAPDLPDFDYIALHGVYSWVSPANRQAIVRFAERRLAPGGLLYVSYNAMPGWIQA